MSWGDFIWGIKDMLALSPALSLWILWCWYCTQKGRDSPIMYRWQAGKQRDTFLCPNDTGHWVFCLFCCPVDTAAPWKFTFWAFRYPRFHCPLLFTNTCTLAISCFSMQPELYSRLFSFVWHSLLALFNKSYLSNNQLCPFFLPDHASSSWPPIALGNPKHRSSLPSSPALQPAHIR